MTDARVASDLFSQMGGLFSTESEGAGLTRKDTTESVHTQEIEGLLAEEAGAQTLASPFTLSEPTFQPFLSPEIARSIASPALPLAASSQGNDDGTPANVEAPKLTGSMPRFPTPDDFSPGLSPASAGMQQSRSSPGAVVDIKAFAGVRAPPVTPASVPPTPKETPSPKSRASRKSFASMRFRSRSVGHSERSPPTANPLMGLGLAGGSTPNSPEHQDDRQRRPSLSLKLSKVFAKTKLDGEQPRVPQTPVSPLVQTPQMRMPPLTSRAPTGMSPVPAIESSAPLPTSRAPSPLATMDRAPSQPKLSQTSKSAPSSPARSTTSGARRSPAGPSAATLLHNIPVSHSTVFTPQRSLATSTSSKATPPPLALANMDFISLPAASSVAFTRFGTDDGPYGALRTVAPSGSNPSSPVEPKPKINVLLAAPPRPASRSSTLPSDSRPTSTSSLAVAVRPKRSSSMMSVNGSPEAIAPARPMQQPMRTGALSLSPASAAVTRPALMPAPLVALPAPPVVTAKPIDSPAPNYLEPPGLKSNPKALRRLSSLSSIPDRLAAERLADFSDSKEAQQKQPSTKSKRRSSLSYLQPLPRLDTSSTLASSSGLSPNLSYFPAVPGAGLIEEEASLHSEDDGERLTRVRVSASSSLEHFAAALEAGLAESTDGGHSEESVAPQRPSTRIFNLIAAALGPELDTAPASKAPQVEQVVEEEGEEEILPNSPLSPGFHTAPLATAEAVEAAMSAQEEEGQEVIVRAPMSTSSSMELALNLPLPLSPIDLSPRSTRDETRLSTATTVEESPASVVEESPLVNMPAPIRSPALVPVQSLVEPATAFLPELDIMSSPIQLIDFDTPFPSPPMKEASPKSTPRRPSAASERAPAPSSSLAVPSHEGAETSDSEALDKSFSGLSTSSSLSEVASPLFDRSRRDSSESAPPSDAGHSNKSASQSGRAGQEEIEYARPGDGRPWTNGKNWTRDISLEHNDADSDDGNDENPINRFSGADGHYHESEELAESDGEVDDEAYSSSDVEEPDSADEDDVPLGESHPEAMHAQRQAQQGQVAEARLISSKRASKMHNPFNFEPNKMQKRDRRGNLQPLPADSEEPQRPASPPSPFIGHPLLPQTDEHVQLRSKRSLARLAAAAGLVRSDSEASRSPTSPILPSFVQESTLAIAGEPTDDTEPLAQFARKATIDQALSSLTNSAPAEPSSTEATTSAPLHASSSKPQVPAANLLQLPRPAGPRPPAARPTPLRVFFDDKDRCAVVQCTDTTSVAEVMQQLHSMGHSPSDDGKSQWALFELWADLGIERPLREYEMVNKIMSSWPQQGADNKIVLKRTKAAFSRLCSRRRAFQKRDHPIGHYLRLETKRGKWEKRWLALDDFAVSSAKSDKSKEKQPLCTMTNWDIYLVPAEYVDQLRPPHAFALALKCTDSLNMFENVDQAIWYLSCKTGQEAETWYSWLFDARSRHLSALRAATVPIQPAGKTLLGTSVAAPQPTPYTPGALLANNQADRSSLKAMLELSGARANVPRAGASTR